MSIQKHLENIQNSLKSLSSIEEDALGDPGTGPDNTTFSFTLKGNVALGISYVKKMLTNWDPKCLLTIDDKTGSITYVGDNWAAVQLQLKELGYIVEPVEPKINPVPADDAEIPTN